MRGSSGLQVRAGEGESEAEGYVLTNPVAKTSMSSGLSSKGKAQVEPTHINCTVSSHCRLALMRHLFICRQPFKAQHEFLLTERASCRKHKSVAALQVLTETAPALKALGACNSDCWLWPSITQVQLQGRYTCCRATLNGLINTRGASVKSPYSIGLTILCALQRSYQTAEILGSLMRLSYQRIVPEYSFLDPRSGTAIFALPY